MKNLFFIVLIVVSIYESKAQVSTTDLIAKSDSMAQNKSYDLAEAFLVKQLRLKTDEKSQFLILAQLCRLSKTNTKISKTIKYGHRALKNDFDKFSALESYGDVLYNTSVAKFKLGELDSAFVYAESALKNRTLNLSENHKKITQNLIALGAYHNSAGNAALNISYKEKALKLALNASPLNYNSLVSSYFSIGNAYQATHNLNKAKENYDTALSFYKDSLATNLEFKGHIFNAIGVILEYQRDYLSSESYYIEAVNIFKSCNNLYLSSLAYSNLANNYSNTGKYFEAKEIHKKVISLFETEEFNNDLAWRYFNLGAAHMQCLEYDSALVVLEKAKKVNIEISKTSNELSTLISNHLASAQLELGNFKKTELELKESIKIAKELYGEKDADLAEAYYLIAKSKFEQKEYAKGLEFLIKAEEALTITTFNNLEYHEEVISKTLLLSIYILKEEVLWEEYKTSKDVFFLKSLYKSSIVSIRLCELIVNFYEHENAKLEIFNAINDNLYLGIIACKELYDISKDEKYIEQALKFFEFEKSFLLKQEYKDLKAKQNNQIPEALILKEEQLKRAVSHQQSLLFTEKSPKSENSKKIGTNIFNLKHELTAFLDKMELDYPQYYIQKYQEVELDIKTLRDDLDKDELALEYFQYKNEVFSISINKQGSRFEKNTVPNLNVKINAYNLAISNSNIQEYSELALEFYTCLLKNHIHNDSINQLTIVPSKSISYLSFDTFLTTKPKNLKYNEIDYLVLKKSISYRNSLQKNKNIRAQAKEVYLGICPEFTDDNKHHLKGALNEVISISKEYDGTILSEKKDLKKNLLIKLPDYKIIHFATHATVNELDSKYSNLMLSSDTLQKNRLHAYEIQNTKINADLVILGACNTGIGKLKTGEGLASLARSFNYAGAKSVLLGLWALPDMATSKIIKHFCTDLTEHKKGIALRNAKVKYLENSDEYTANPRYWGGLILIGENDPLDLKLTVKQNINYLIYLVLVSFLFLLLLRRKLV